MKKYILFVICTLIFFACKQKNTTETINIYHAGSLSAPFKAITDDFLKEYPNIKIKIEVGGSLANARKVTDAKGDCDIFASADYKIVDNLLIPEYTNHNILFARNEMVIVKSPNAKHKNKINSENWVEILLLNEVKFGRSDPNSDPCGYRSEILIDLAQILNPNFKFKDKLLNKDKNNIRPKEVDLIALLQTNSIDYAFLYLSVAKQHKLEYVTLNDSINLGKLELEDFYNKGKTEIAGKTPDSKQTIYGEPIVYSVSLMHRAKDNEAALNFLDFLLNEEKGLKIMREQFQLTLKPQTKEFEHLPELIKKHCIKKNK